MSIKDLRERLANKVAEAKHLIAEKGDATWSDEDQKKYDDLIADCERIEAQIKNEQRILDLEAEEAFQRVGASAYRGLLPRLL